MADDRTKTHPDLALAELMAEVSFQMADDYGRQIELAFAMGSDYCTDSCRCYVTWENVSMTRAPDLHLNGCPTHS